MADDMISRAKSIVIWTTEEKHAAIKAEAKLRGISVSEFVRQMANKGFKADRGY